MNATFVDLRYKTAEILAALDKREHVTILYHGKPRATIVPLGEEVTAGLISRFKSSYAKNAKNPPRRKESFVFLCVLRGYSAFFA